MRSREAPILEDAPVLLPILRTNRNFYIIVLVLGSIVAWGLFAWAYQLANGLGVTGLNRPQFWGIYLVNFVFFIGISHAGTLISAILRVTKAEWRRPITRSAEAITVFALMVGPINVIIDMGRPDRILHVLQYGRFQSPLLWDVIAITTYLIGSLIYLYLPLIPDLATIRDIMSKQDPRWRFYQIMSLGWTGTELQKKRLNTAINIMMIIIIPIAVSVHTVVSWVFAMTVQPMWHSTIFGPYFVVGAIYSGIGTLLIAMAVLRKVLHLEDYLVHKHFNYLGLLMLAMAIIWFYFTFAEYLTTFYGGEPAHMSVFNAKFRKEFFGWFWGMGLFDFVIPFLILAFPQTRTILGTVIASIFVDVGMWMERFNIIVPTLSRPRLPYQWGIYAPTWVEISITAGLFAAFTLFYVLFSKFFPLVSMWEVKEGREKELEAQEALAIAHREGS